MNTINNETGEESKDSSPKNQLPQIPNFFQASLGQLGAKWRLSNTRLASRLGSRSEKWPSLYTYEMDRYTEEGISPYTVIQIGPRSLLVAVLYPAERDWTLEHVVQMHYPEVQDIEAELILPGVYLVEWE